jgi:hypothetical protein
MYTVSTDSGSGADSNRINLVSYDGVSRGSHPSRPQSETLVLQIQLMSIVAIAFKNPTLRPKQASLVL